jgi:hypothetical protein
MRRRLLIFLLLATGAPAIAQSAADTAAVIGEFDEVMAFAVQPYVHFTCVMALHAGPMLPPGDTGRILHSDFYKYEDNLYYGNEQEEMYLQDSLMIRVNHHQKVIQISKVDVATKKNMDILPLKRTDRQKLLRNRYTIGKMPDRGDTGVIVIRPQAGRTAGESMNTEILMEYAKSSHLPLLMRMTTRQRASETVAGALKANGFDVVHMVEEEAGIRSLIMTQTASMRFETMDTTKETAMHMPLWKDKIAYDPMSGNYMGRGDYTDYRIIKTF